jgi:hypothetical protein
MPPPELRPFLDALAAIIARQALAERNNPGPLFDAAARRSISPFSATLLDVRARAAPARGSSRRGSHCGSTGCGMSVGFREQP